MVAPQWDPLLGQGYKLRSDVFVHPYDLRSFVPGDTVDVASDLIKREQLWGMWL